MPEYKLSAGPALVVVRIGETAVLLLQTAAAVAVTVTVAVGLQNELEPDETTAVTVNVLVTVVVTVPELFDAEDDPEELAELDEFEGAVPLLTGLLIVVPMTSKLQFKLLLTFFKSWTEHPIDEEILSHVSPLTIV